MARASIGQDMDDDYDGGGGRGDDEDNEEYSYGHQENQNLLFGKLHPPCNEREDALFDICRNQICQVTGDQT